MAALAQFFPGAAAVKTEADEPPATSPAASPAAASPAAEGAAAATMPVSDAPTGGDDQGVELSLAEEKEALTSGTLLKSAYELAREERIRQCVARTRVTLARAAC